LEKKAAFVYKSFRAVIFYPWAPEKHEDPTQLTLLATGLFFHSCFLPAPGLKSLTSESPGKTKFSRQFRLVQEINTAFLPNPSVHTQRTSARPVSTER